MNTYNIRIHQVPYNLVANQIGYQARELFEADPEALEDIDVSERFSPAVGSQA